MMKEHNELEDRDKPFLMSIVDVFVMKGRGTAITGTVESGTAAQGDLVEIGLPASGISPIKTTITRFEGFTRNLESYVAFPSDNVAILFRELSKDQIEIGMVIAAPGSIDFSSP